MRRTALKTKAISKKICVYVLQRALILVVFFTIVEEKCAKSQPGGSQKVEVSMSLKSLDA